MSKIKCQCGHENPFGTVLCERCGRPQTEEAKKSKLWTCVMKVLRVDHKRIKDRLSIKYGTSFQVLKSGLV